VVGGGLQSAIRAKISFLEIIMANMLQFHKEMISNLYPSGDGNEPSAEDGLLVVAKGYLNLTLGSD
jgi:hypothetical protein